MARDIVLVDILFILSLSGDIYFADLMEEAKSKARRNKELEKQIQAMAVLTNDLQCVNREKDIELTKKDKEIWTLELDKKFWRWELCHPAEMKNEWLKLE